MKALHQAGAGNIGNYHQCSFRVTGTGTFLPNENAKPTFGQSLQKVEMQEDKIELIFPTHMKKDLLSVLKMVHPYEEVGYYIQDLQNEYQEVGSGLIGELPEPISPSVFLAQLKKQMNLAVIKYTAITDKK